MVLCGSVFIHPSQGTGKLRVNSKEAGAAGRFCCGRPYCLTCVQDPQCTLKSKCTRKHPGKLSSLVFGGTWLYFREKSYKAKTRPLSVTPDGKARETWTPERSVWLLERDHPGKEDGAMHNNVFTYFFLNDFHKH